jgi:hypothetical protein
MDMPMPAAPSSNHGFYLFGEKTFLLSHIPMFMDPHQAQLFLEVGLSISGGADPVKIYHEDQKKYPGSLYVLVTDPLVLPTLAPDAPKPLRAFTGKVYRNWPFDDLTKAPVVIPALDIKVTRSIFFRSFIGAKPLSKLSYYCFRTAESTYLAHVITQPPDFNQILTAEVHGVDPGHHALELEFSATNSINHKLPPKHEESGVLASGGKHAKVHTKAQLVYDAEHLAKAMPAAK